MISIRPKKLRIAVRVSSINPRSLHMLIEPYSWSVEELLREAGNRMLRDAVRLGDAFSHLASSIGLFNVYVKEVWDTSIEKIRYVADEYLKLPDAFMSPDTTLSLGFGDCEDKSILVESAIIRLIHIYNEPAKSYAVIGYANTASGGGHAWIIYSHPRLLRSTWMMIETTLRKPLPLDKWIIQDFDKFIPVYFFDDKHTYRIDRDHHVLGLTKEYVEKYWRKIHEIIEYMECKSR